MVRPCWGAGLGGGGRNLLSQEPDPALGDPVPDSLHTKKKYIFKCCSLSYFTQM